MGYEQVDDFRLNWKLTVMLNLIAGGVFILGFYLFSYFYLTYSEDSFGIKLLEHSNLWVTYGLIFAQVILHEYSHGVGYRLSGGRVSYGVKWLCPYCREVTGLYYPAESFILTLLLPLITGTGIGILAIILLPQFLYYIIICMLTNISGAAGDIMMLLYVVFKSDKGDFIRDEPYGFSVHRKVFA